jgi:excinuclease ABC subunit C
LREATSLESELDFIIGLGEKRKRQLLTKYANLDEIRAASVEDLSQISGFNRVLAERILIQLNEESQLSGEEGGQAEDTVQTFPDES